MAGAKVCLKVEHMPQHGDADICPLCNGEILRFVGNDPGLDDLMDESEIRETLVVTTRAGFTLHLEDAGTDNHGNQLWRQIRARLGSG